MIVSSMTDEQLTALSNTVKEELINTLEQEGLLKESAEVINQKYAVILYRRGFFGRIIDKMLGNTDNNLNVSVVKLL